MGMYAVKFEHVLIFLFVTSFISCKSCWILFNHVDSCLILLIQVKIPLEITFSYVVMIGRLHATPGGSIRCPFVSLHWEWGLGGTMGCRGYRRWGFMSGAPIGDIYPSWIRATLFKGRRGKPDPVTCRDEPRIRSASPNRGRPHGTPSNLFWQWIGGRGVGGGTPWGATPSPITMIRVTVIFPQRRS